MIINSANVRAAFNGFNTIFNMAFAEAKPIYQKIAMTVPSTTAAETYAWLTEMPGMREWIGSREVNNLSASGYTIANKDFEMTVSILQKYFEDDQIGVYRPAMQELARLAGEHPDELIFGLLNNAFTALCYDGKPFFSSEHPVGDKKISNKGTAALSAASYEAARTGMMSLVNSKGQPLSIIPNLLVVPPALETMAQKILVSDFIDGSTNPLKGTADILVAPRLAGKPNAWFLMDVSRSVKPLIYQERKKAKFVAKDKVTDDNMFWDGAAIYGVDSRGNAGFGFWQMAYGSDGTT